MILAEMVLIQSPADGGHLFELVLFGAGVVLTLGIAGLFLFLLTRKDGRVSSERKDESGTNHDSTNG